MSKLSQLGRNTPLWRRVQRHAQMSAIFAPPMATAISSPFTFAPTQPATDGELQSWDVVETAVPPSQPAPISPTSLPTRPAAALAQPTLQRAESSTAVPTPQPIQTHTPADSEKAEDEANWRRLQTIMQHHRQKQAAEKANEETAATIQQKTEAAVEPSAPDEAEAAADIQQNESPAPAMQSLPLEAAWPVQKKSSQTPPSATTQPQPTPPPKVVQHTPLPEEEASQINQNLARVAPGRQTQSPIETLMPSRPRPQPKAPNPVQRQPAKKTATPEAAPTTTDEITAVSTPAPTPKLIPTEIGPLPADLWETLGELPPETLAVDEPTVAAAPAPTETTVPDVQTTAAPQQADVPRLERTLPEPPGKPVAPSTEQKDVGATAVPTRTPKPTNIIMAKPVQPTAEAASTAVSLTNSNLNVPTTPTDVAAQPADEARAQIQRQAVETAVATLLPMSPTSDTGEEKVNITQKSTTETEPATKETTHLAHKAEISLAPPKPLAEPAASSTTLIQAKPIQPSKLASSSQATAVTTPPGSQTQPISPAPATLVNRETAAASKPHNQPVAVSSETIIQRLPDLPAALETVTEAVSPSPMEMMPEEATAVLTEISPAEAEEEPATKENLDIDALSRQVYQQLKRKLAVEWERGYGR